MHPEKGVPSAVVWSSEQS